MITITRIGTSMLEGIYALCAERKTGYSSKAILHAMWHEKLQIVAALDGERIVGQVFLTQEVQLYEPGKLWWNLGSIYVTPEYRGQGICKKMIRYIEEIAPINSVSCLKLVVNPHNAAGFIYLACGFEPSQHHEMCKYL